MAQNPCQRISNWPYLLVFKMEVGDYYEDGRDEGAFGGIIAAEAL